MSDQHEDPVPNREVPVERPERSTATTERRRTKVLRWFESVLLFSGLVFVMVYGCVRTHSELMSQAGLWSFKAHKSMARAAREYDSGGGKVDFRRWSAKRVKAYTQALSAKLGVPLAVLSIPMEILKLMTLYPQPVRRTPTVEYLPGRRVAERRMQFDESGAGA